MVLEVTAPPLQTQPPLVLGLEQRAGTKCLTIRHLSAQHTLESFRIETCHLEQGDKASYPVCGTIPCFIFLFLDTLSSKKGSSSRLHHKSPNFTGRRGRTRHYLMGDMSIIPSTPSAPFFFALFFCMWLLAINSGSRHRRQQLYL